MSVEGQRSTSPAVPIGMGSDLDIHAEGMPPAIDLTSSREGARESGQPTALVGCESASTLGAAAGLPRSESPDRAARRTEDENDTGQESVECKASGAPTEPSTPDLEAIKSNIERIGNVLQQVDFNVQNVVTVLDEVGVGVKESAKLGSKLEKLRIAFKQLEARMGAWESPARADPEAGEGPAIATAEHAGHRSEQAGAARLGESSGSSQEGVTSVADKVTAELTEQVRRIAGEVAAQLAELPRLLRPLEAKIDALGRMSRGTIPHGDGTEVTGRDPAGWATTPHQASDPVPGESLSAGWESESSLEELLTQLPRLFDAVDENLFPVENRLETDDYRPDPDDGLLMILSSIHRRMSDWSEAVGLERYPDRRTLPVPFEKECYRSVKSVECEQGRDGPVVLRVIEFGYRWHGRLVRKASVIRGVAPAPVAMPEVDDAAVTSDSRPGNH